MDGPAVDVDGDGRLDFLCGNWPPGGSRFFRNETPGGNWLQVRVEGTKMNRMGVGAQVRLYPAGPGDRRAGLLGVQEITLNGGYSSSRPALVHFGLGTLETCDVEITFPTRAEPLVLRKVRANQRHSVQLCIVLNDRLFRHLPLIELDEVIIGRKVDYWRDWWDHQTNDEWWHQFHHRPEKLQVPIFQQGGWFDPYSGSHLRKFAAIGDRASEPRADGAVVARGGRRGVHGRRRPQPGV